MVLKTVVYVLFNLVTYLCFNLPYSFGDIYGTQPNCSNIQNNWHVKQNSKTEIST